MSSRSLLSSSLCRSGAVFSSQKCPASADQASSCELPFGFCWTPLASLGSKSSESSASTAAASATDTDTSTDGETTVLHGALPPVLCVTCLSYLNLYCTINDNDANSKSKTWTCPLCQCPNVYEESSIMERVLRSPVTEFRQPLASPTTNSSSSSNPLAPPAVQAETVIYVVDANLKAADAMAIGSIIEELSKATKKPRQQQQIGLVVFDKNVSIYQLGVHGMAAADVVGLHSSSSSSNAASSDEAVNDDNAALSAAAKRFQERSYLSDTTDTLLLCLQARFGTSTPSSSSSSKIVDDNDASAATPPKKSRLQILKERKQARMQQNEQANSGGGGGTAPSPPPPRKHLPTSPWTAARENDQPPVLRCTGEAIQCAIDLISFSASSSTTTASSAAASNSNTGRILLFTNGPPNIGDGSVCRLDNTNITSYYDDGNGQQQSNGIGAHIVDAGRLARASEYFDVIAKAAEGIGMDVFLTGSLELGLPAFQSLVEPSSGYVLSHDSFASPHLRENVAFVLHETNMSLAQFEKEEDDEVHATTEHQQQQQQQQHFPQASWIDGCTVDIRMSSFLNPTHLIGPGDLVESPDGPLINEQGAYDRGVRLMATAATTAQGKSSTLKERSKQQQHLNLDMLQSSLTRIRLGRYDPLSTFSVMLRLNDFFQHDEYAFVQCTVRYVDNNSSSNSSTTENKPCLVTRVTTHRLSVASDIGDFLQAINEEVVPVLLGKEAVYRSMFGRDVDVEHPFHAPHVGQLDSLAYDAQRDLDNTVFRISGAYRLLSLEEGTRTIDLTEEGGIKAAGSSMDFAFPPELSDALRRLYHLRRGPFLSPGPLQSMDDRAEMRALFVRLPLEDCLSMMAPALWSSGPVDEAKVSGPSMEAVPPETLSLWENRIIAADLSHSLFVWSGSTTLAPEYDSIRENLHKFLLERSHKRFPMPNVHILTETDSMSRRFTALLAPSHGDPVEHQMAHFPALAQLSMEEQAKLHSRFKFYDPASDPSFRKWFWEVASASSACREEGISLCE